jgi:hypothetical protein
MLENHIINKVTYEEFQEIHKNYTKFQQNLFLVNETEYIIINSSNPRDYHTSSIHVDKNISFIKQRYIEDFYIKGLYLDILKLENKYYRFSPPNIQKPFVFENRDTYRSINFQDCIFTVNKEKIESLYNIYNLYYALDQNIYKVYNREKEINLYLEKGEKNKDLYFLKGEKEHFDGMIKYRKFNNTHDKIVDHSYDQVADLVDIKKINLKYGVESLTHKAFEGIKYTYGIELETIGGRVSEEEADGLNFKTVHDGSLRGPNGEDPLGAEYVTGVLIGDSGLTQLAEICRVVGKNCTIDKRCGVHIHIGSLNWNKEEVVFAYLLGELIENDLFSILPVSRRKNSYCRPLTKLLSNRFLTEFKQTSNKLNYKLLIDEAYDLIYKEVTFAGEPIPKNIITDININKRKNHPKGSKCGYIKSSQRYCWLNFVTLLFNTKGIENSHTIEIRNHGGTMNFKKIRNWLKISIAFCRFVEEFKSDILNKEMTLEYIVSKVFPKTGKPLTEYIQTRRDLFRNHTESIDYLEVEEVNKQSIKEVVKCV